MSNNYNFENLQRLITEGFKPNEIIRLCQFNSDFEPLFKDLNDTMPISDISDRLILYASQKLLVPQLLTFLEKENPRMYGKHKPYITKTESKSGQIKNDNLDYELSIIKSKKVHQRNSPIGRDENKNEAITILRDNRILLLYGTPGQGKTELARYIALSSENSYSDGVYEVDLQNEKQIENVFKLLGTALGNTDTGNPIEFLKTKNVLIILDGFERLLRSNDVQKIRNFFDILFNSLSDVSRIIVTSQDKIDTTLVVPKLVQPLDGQYALELFNKEARNLYSSDDKEELLDFITSDLGGHPLSIKIVASYSNNSKVDLETLRRLWREKWTSIAKYAPSLDYHALNTSFELSYDSLGPYEQLFFLDMSLLPDGIYGRDHIRIMWNDQETVAYDAAKVLKERSLIEDAGHWYKMLGPVFRYAIDKRQIIENDPDNPLSIQLLSHALVIDSYYDQFVLMYAPQETDINPNSKNNKIREHFYNIHASLDRRLEPSTNPITLEAANSVLRLYWAYHNNLSGYKNAISSAEDAIYYLDKARHIFDINNEQEKATRCQYYIGNILWLRGNISKAQPYLNEVLVSDWASAEMKLDCKRAVAHIEYKEGSLTRSAALYEEVVRESQIIDYTECRIRCHIGLIDAYRKIEEYEKAINYVKSIENELSKLHPSIYGNVIRGYAYVLLLDGKLAEAEARYKEALSIFMNVSAFGQAHCRRGLGDVFVKMSRYDEAEYEFDAAMKLYDDARKNPSLGVGLVEMGRGRLALANADINKALLHFRKAVGLFDRQNLNEPYEEAQAHELLGDSLKQVLRLEEALGHYQLALIQYQKTDCKPAARRMMQNIKLIETIRK